MITREENGLASLQCGKQQVCGSNGAGSDTLHFIFYISFDCLVSVLKFLYIDL